MQKNRRFNLIALIMYSFMGVFLAANQTLVTNIALALEASESEMGLMISAMYAGSTAAVLLFGELSLKLGKTQTAALTAAVVALGAGAVFCAGTAFVAALGFFVYGCGIGAFESLILSLITDNNGQDSNRVVNLMQSLFSVGAVAAPLVIAALFRPDQFRPLYALIFVWYLLACAYLLFSRDTEGFVREGEKAVGGAAFISLLKSGPMIAYMFAMFIYLGSETAFTYWIGSYFSAEGFADLGAAAISAYWFASIFGRLIATRFRSPDTLMPPCFALAAAGCTLLLIFPGAVLKLVAVVITGLAFAPVYAGLSLMAGELFPERSAPAISLMIFSAGVGGMLFQPLISPLVAANRADALYVLLAALCVACAVLLLLIRRRVRGQ